MSSSYNPAHNITATYILKKNKGRRQGVQSLTLLYMSMSGDFATCSTSFSHADMCELEEERRKSCLHVY